MPEAFEKHENTTRGPDVYETVGREDIREKIRGLVADGHQEAADWQHTYEELLSDARDRLRDLVRFEYTELNLDPDGMAEPVELDLGSAPLEASADEYEMLRREPDATRGQLEYYLRRRQQTRLFLRLLYREGRGDAVDLMKRFDALEAPALTAFARLLSFEVSKLAVKPTSLNYLI